MFNDDSTFENDPIFNDDLIFNNSDIKLKSSLPSFSNIFKPFEPPPNRYFDSADKAFEVVKR